MRKKIIILISFILSSINFSTAQVCEKVDCNAIKDYVTIKIIEESVKKDPNEKALKDSFKKNAIETPLSYSEFSNVLSSNDFLQTKEKLGDILNSIVMESDYSKEEFATKLMENFASKLSDKQKKAFDFDNLKGKLILEINTYLDKKITNSNVENQTSVGQESSDVAFQNLDNDQDAIVERPSFFSFSNFNFFILLCLIISISLFIVSLIKINSLNEKNERRKEQIRKLEPSPFSGQNNSYQISKTEFENLLSNSQAFEQFRQAIENLQKQSSNYPQIVSSNQSSNQTPNPSSFSSNIFFMKYPVENSFSNNHKSLTKENTIYKFSLKPNNTEADYEIHTEGVKIDEIISMVERTIKTGCDEDNNPSNNTRNIKTLSKGIVSLEGDKWVIKRKAIIRYE